MHIITRKSMQVETETDGGEEEGKDNDNLVPWVPLERRDPENEVETMTPMRAYAHDMNIVWKSVD